MKKIVSLLLVVALVATCFVGCAKNVTIECTCDCNKQKNADGSATAAAAYTKLTAKGKSGVDCSKMPEDTAAIIKLYNDVGNATKATQNQSFKMIDTGAKTNISSVKLGKSGKPLSDSLMGTVKNLIKQFAPEGTEADYKFQSGVDANGNKDGDGNAKKLVDALPIGGEKVLSKLGENDVSEAKIEKLDDGYWKLTIVVKEAKIKFTDPKVNPDTPQSRFVGVMKSSDFLKSFGPAKVKSADIDYKDSSLTAVIDPSSGYLVQLTTHMDYDMVVNATLSVAGALVGDIEITSDITYNWSEIG